MPAVRGVAIVILLLWPAPALGQGWSARWLTGPRAASQLTSADPAARLQAAQTLGRHGDARRAVRALGEALPGERDPRVRSAMVRALVRRGSPDAAPALVQAFSGGRGVDRDVLAAGLGVLRSGEAIEALVTALGDREAAVPARAGLARAGARAIPALLRALTDPATAAQAAHALGAIGDRRATGPLIELSRDPGEPERHAAVVALGRIGDQRAARPLVARTRDESPRVVLAALDALASVGGPAQRQTLRALAGEGSPQQQRLAFRALQACDPRAGAEALAEAVTSDDPTRVRMAADVALESTHPGLVPIVYGLLREGSRADEAASALAEAEDGAGVPVLLAEAGSAPPVGPAATRALAVALRRWEGRVDRASRRAGLAILRGDASPRGLLLRAVARDPDVAAALRTGLASDDATVRASSATALETLGDPDHAADVAAALVVERDPTAFRAQAEAVVTLGARVPVTAVLAQLDDADTAPEAMLVAAHGLERASLRQARELRRRLRRGLRDPDARVRAGAARALAVAGDREAFRALLAVLEEDQTEVRRAAARALEVLAHPDAVEPILELFRLEADPRMREALRDAALAPQRRPPAGFSAAGRQILRIRIASEQGEERAGVPVDVVLEDGRWLRVRTLPSGELFLTDLPYGDADVRIRVAL